MRAYFASRHVPFVVSTGDNIYSTGLAEGGGLISKHAPQRRAVRQKARKKRENKEFASVIANGKRDRGRLVNVLESSRDNIVTSDLIHTTAPSHRAAGESAASTTATSATLTTDNEHTLDVNNRASDYSRERIETKRERDIAEDNGDLIDGIFEDPYIDTAPNVPWHLTMGNHDCYGDVDAMIEYTNAIDPATKLPYTRLNFPARYYEVDLPIPAAKRTTTPATGSAAASSTDNYGNNTATSGGTSTTNAGFVRFLLLDTCSLVCADPNHAVNMYEYLQCKHMRHNALTATRVAQSKWLKSRIISAETTESIRGVVLVGHHPAFSVGPHGTNLALLSFLGSAVRGRKTLMYVSGHDHTLQHFEIPRDKWVGAYGFVENPIKRYSFMKQRNSSNAQGNNDDLPPFHQVVSGAGAVRAHGQSYHGPFPPMLFPYSSRAPGLKRCFEHWGRTQAVVRGRERTSARDRIRDRDLDKECGQPGSGVMEAAVSAALRIPTDRRIYDASDDSADGGNSTNASPEALARNQCSDPRGDCGPTFAPFTDPKRDYTTVNNRATASPGPRSRSRHGGADSSRDREHTAKEGDRWFVPRLERFPHPNPFLAPEATLYRYPHYLAGLPQWFESYQNALPVPAAQMFGATTGFVTLRVSRYGVKCVFIDAEGRVIHQFAQLYA